MTELKPVTPEVLLHISKTLQVPMRGLVASIGLLDEGSTVPFIARYRKEATGNLDEVQIRSIAEKLAYFRELQDRRTTVLASIEEQGKLTPNSERALKPLWRRASLRISTCPISQSAAPRRPSPAQRASNRLPFTFGNSGLPIPPLRNSPQASSMPNLASRMSTRRSKARVTSSRNGSASTPISANAFARG